MTPMETPSRSERGGQDRPYAGTARRAARPARGTPSRATPAMSSMWIVRRSQTARPPTLLCSRRWSRRSACAQAAARGRRRMPSKSPSRRKIAHWLAPQNRAALSATTSITGWRSVGELEMTRRISAVAVCCSSASVTSLALHSLNSRTFSMAITAWSAKVLSRAICLSEKGPASSRATVIAPMVVPSRSIGTDRTLLVAGRACPVLAPVLGIPVDIGDVNNGADRESIEPSHYFGREELGRAVARSPALPA